MAQGNPVPWPIPVGSSPNPATSQAQPSQEQDLGRESSLQLKDQQTGNRSPESLPDYRTPSPFEHAPFPHNRQTVTKRKGTRSKHNLKLAPQVSPPQVEQRLAKFNNQLASLNEVFVHNDRYHQVNVEEIEEASRNLAEIEQQLDKDKAEIEKDKALYYEWQSKFKDKQLEYNHQGVDINRVSDNIEINVHQETTALTFLAILEEKRNLFTEMKRLEEEEKKLRCLEKNWAEAKQELETLELQKLEIGQRFLEEARAWFRDNDDEFKESIVCNKRALEEQIDTLTNQNEDLERDLEAGRKTTGQLNGKLSLVNGKLKKSREERKSLTEDHEALKDEIETINSNAHGEESTTQKQLKKSRELRQDLRKKNKELEERVASLESESKERRAEEESGAESGGEESPPTKKQKMVMSQDEPVPLANNEECVVEESGINLGSEEAPPASHKENADDSEAEVGGDEASSFGEGTADDESNDRFKKFLEDDSENELGDELKAEMKAQMEARLGGQQIPPVTHEENPYEDSGEETEINDKYGASREDQLSPNTKKRKMEVDEESGVESGGEQRKKRKLATPHKRSQKYSTPSPQLSSSSKPYDHSDDDSF